MRPGVLHAGRVRGTTQRRNQHQPGHGCKYSPRERTNRDRHRAASSSALAALRHQGRAVPIVVSSAPRSRGRSLGHTTTSLLDDAPPELRLPWGKRRAELRWATAEPSFALVARQFRECITPCTGRAMFHCRGTTTARVPSSAANTGLSAVTVKPAGRLRRPGSSQRWSTTSARFRKRGRAASMPRLRRHDVAGGVRSARARPAECRCIRVRIRRSQRCFCSFAVIKYDC
jgi:hypothetical protein